MPFYSAEMDNMSSEIQKKCRILQSLTGHTSDVTTCDFAPNYTLITGSSDKTVRLWNWIAGSGYVESPNSPLRGHKYGVTCVRVSPQGSMLATSSIDGTAVLWNLHSCIKIYTMVQINGDAIRVCRFAPDSSVLVTAGDNGAICIWDLVHRSLIRTLLDHEGTTHSLSFTPDSQYLVSACSLEILKIWSVQNLMDTTSSSSCTAVASADNIHDLGALCSDISPSIKTDEFDTLTKLYTLAISGNSQEIKIWTIISRVMPKHKNSPNSVSIELTDTYTGHCSAVTCIRYNSNGTYLISSSLDKLVKIWDVDGNCVATLDGHTRYVNCVAFSRNTRLAVSGSNDKLLHVWDLMNNMSLESEFFKFTSQPHLINGNIQETQVVSYAENDDNEIQLLEKVDDISDGAINSCCFYGKDILATGSSDKLVKLFRVSTDTGGLEEMIYSPLESHTYAINHVEFSSDGKMLASCSLDGCTNIWDPTTGEKLVSVPKNSLSVKTCRFSPNNQLLITAGDDEKAVIWDVETVDELATLEGHLDSITSAAFSPDNELIVTTCNNADFRLWLVKSFDTIHSQDDAHDLGIQSCDFSQNLEPIPNTDVVALQSYLLATCGNDSLVKLWWIVIPKDKDGDLQYEEIEVKLWRTLTGHGGNVTCVIFSPSAGEIVCSTASDRQARLWSVYSGECLHVMDHDSIVTACSFSIDCSILAVGCLDKTLWLWRLPQQLVFHTAVANKLNCHNKAIVDWTTSDVVKWLKKINFEEISQNVQNANLDGQKLLTLPPENICSGLDLSEEQTERMFKEIKWLKQDDLQMQPNQTSDYDEIPHEFLCPITHEIMRDPVTCSDGFTYEKRAITEWFMSGKYTSPMTNEILQSTSYTHNQEMRNAIHNFLYNEE